MSSCRKQKLEGQSHRGQRTEGSKKETCKESVELSVGEETVRLQREGHTHVRC